MTSPMIATDGCLSNTLMLDGASTAIGGFEPILHVATFSNASA